MIFLIGLQLYLAFALLYCRHGCTYEILFLAMLSRYPPLAIVKVLDVSTYKNIKLFLKVDILA